MSEDQDHINTALANAELYKRLVVQPMIDAVRAELKSGLTPIASVQDSHASRIGATETAVANLQASQKKALIGWGVLSLGVASAVSAGWQVIKSHFSVRL